MIFCKDCMAVYITHFVKIFIAVFVKGNFSYLRCAGRVQHFVHTIYLCVSGVCLCFGMV